MEVVVITAEYVASDEMESIQSLLALGARLHVRKPTWPISDLSEFIMKIQQKYYDQLSVHGALPIAQQLHLGGVHLKSNQQANPHEQWSGRLSKSFHSTEEILQTELPLDYALLSPVFDSISKKGYSGSLNHYDLQEQLPTLKKKVPVYALGGISLENIQLAADLGFDGVAVLGTIWQQPTSKDRLNIYEKLIAAC